MRTIRQRLDMNALISDLCERDVPEIDWEKLGEDSNSVFGIYFERQLAGLAKGRRSARANVRTCLRPRHLLQRCASSCHALHLVAIVVVSVCGRICCILSRDD